MVIINEKQAAPLPPPPPYVHTPATSYPQQQQQPYPSSPAYDPQLHIHQQLAALHQRQQAQARAHALATPVLPSPGATLPPAPPPPPTLATLPPHLILKIVYTTFPTGPDYDFVRTRQVLYWLAACLRATCRALYTACMHVLRSSYLPAYAANVRGPYSSDPFPVDGAAQCETAVLDRFLLLKVREDVRMDESDLHLDLDSFKDVFDIFQPRARMEDLVRQMGTAAGVVAAAAGSAPRGVLPFAALSISFSTRRVALVFTERGGRKRTLVQVDRSRDERLESSARRIVDQLVRLQADHALA